MRKSLLYIIAIILGAYCMARKCEPELISKEKRAKRSSQNFIVACKWIGVLQDGKSIRDYFSERRTEKVAIYGMGDLGRCLLRELQQIDVKVEYIIDKNQNQKMKGYSFFSPEDYLPEVDIIIITPSYDYLEIAENLNKRVKAAIISLQSLSL